MLKTRTSVSSCGVTEGAYGRTYRSTRPESLGQLGEEAGRSDGPDTCVPAFTPAGVLIAHSTSRGLENNAESGAKSLPFHGQPCASFGRDPKPVWDRQPSLWHFESVGSSEDGLSSQGRATARV
jgi:hypothetical protein